MNSPDQLTALLQTLATAVNLALTAWIIRQTSTTQREVKRNTRVSRQARDNAGEVKEKTNGVLMQLVTRLEQAADKLAQAAEAMATGATVEAKKRLPRKRGKSK